MISIPEPILGELIAGAVNHLKCCPCTDQAITGNTDTDAIPDAVTIAPVLQTIPAGGQQVGGIVPMPVCLDCRKKQLGVASKAGLVTV